MSHSVLDFYQKDFEIFKAHLNQSGLQDVSGRQKAFDLAMQMQWPTAQDEKWKYTKLYDLFQHQFSANVAIKSQNVPENVIKQLNLNDTCLNLVFFNGEWQAELSSKLDSITGLSVQRVTPVIDKVDISNSVTSDIFSCFNQSFCRETLEIQVKAGAVIDKPIYILWLVDAASEMAFYPRKLIHLEAGASLTMLEEFRSLSNPSVYLTNSDSQIILEEDARLNYAYLQQESQKAFHIFNQRIEQHEQSELISHAFGIGGQLGRCAMHVHLKEKQARCSLNGLYTGKQKQLTDMWVHIDHAAPECISQQYFKGILADQARGVFTGKIHVHPHANGSDAKQMNKNLLLSKLAEVDTRPQLQIDHDDVACSHGATIGQLDENALFYLKSRGISNHEAKAILISAFAREQFDKIKHAQIKEKLSNEMSALSFLPMLEA